MAAISKFHIGSKIINADTQTDVGTILHDGSLKTVNGVSLVGSGDFSPLSLTLIGSTSSTATFTHDLSQYKFILFEYVGNSRETMLERYQVLTNKYHSFHDSLEQDNTVIKFSIATNSITLELTTQAQVTMTVYGVK